MSPINPSGNQPRDLRMMGNSCIFQMLKATASKTSRYHEWNVTGLSSNMLADLANANSMITSVVRHLFGKSAITLY